MRDVEILEVESLERDTANTVSERAADLKELVDAGACLSELSVIGRGAVDSTEEVSLTTVGLLRQEADNALIDVGTELPRLSSTEAAADNRSQVVLTLETISTKIKEIWEAIKRSLLSFFEAVSKFFTGIKERFLRGKARAEKAKGKMDSVSPEDWKKQDVQGYKDLTDTDLEFIAVEGKLPTGDWPRDSSRSLIDFLGWVQFTEYLLSSKQEEILDGITTALNSKDLNAESTVWKFPVTYANRTIAMLKSQFDDLPKIPGNATLTVKEYTGPTTATLATFIAQAEYIHSCFSLEKLPSKVSGSVSPTSYEMVEDMWGILTNWNYNEGEYVVDHDKMANSLTSLLKSGLVDKHLDTIDSDSVLKLTRALTQLITGVGQNFQSLWRYGIAQYDGSTSTYLKIMKAHLAETGHQPL